MTNERTAVIAGTARNCAKHLRRVLHKIDKIAAVFDRHAVVIVENDSIDDTRAVLFDWAGKRPNVHIETEDNLLPGAIRTEHIAYCRNRALAVGRERYADFDFLVWVDMDEPIRNLNISEFERAVAYISSRPDISGVFASSTPRYYDVWALRHPKWCPSDCWAEFEVAKRDLSPKAAMALFVHRRMIAIDPTHGPIEVISAFNGLAIYRMVDALQSEYCGTNPDGTPLCEHVHFNKGLTNAGKRLVIFPGLRVAAPNEHLPAEAQSTLWKVAKWARNLFERDLRRAFGRIIKGA